MLVHLCLSVLLSVILPIDILHCYLWANKMMMMMMIERYRWRDSTRRSDVIASSSTDWKLIITTSSNWCLDEQNWWWTMTITHHCDTLLTGSSVKCQKNILLAAPHVCRRVRIGGAGGRRNVRPCRMQQRTVQSFRCALKVVPWKSPNWRHRVPDSWCRDTECLGLEVVDPCRRLIE